MKILVLLILILSACKEGEAIKPTEDIKDGGSSDGNTFKDSTDSQSEEMTQCPVYISETAKSLKQKCTHEIRKCYENATSASEIKQCANEQSLSCQRCNDSELERCLEKRCPAAIQNQFCCRRLACPISDPDCLIQADAGVCSAEAAATQECLLGNQDCADLHSFCVADCIPGESCAVCGNGTIEESEECEGLKLNGKTCVSEGLGGGTLSCSTNCNFDLSSCIQCGDGNIDQGEICDGRALGGNTCKSQGFLSGVIRCRENCSLDLSFCRKCGNGVADPGEVCDGSDFDGETCASLLFTAGTLGCSSDCRQLTTTSCTTCRNGVREGDEECDVLVGAATCNSLGFAGGTLRCQNDCRFDTTNCTN